MFSFLRSSVVLPLGAPSLLGCHWPQPTGDSSILGRQLILGTADEGSVIRKEAWMENRRWDYSDRSGGEAIPLGSAAQCYHAAFRWLGGLMDWSGRYNWPGLGRYRVFSMTSRFGRNRARPPWHQYSGDRAWRGWGQGRHFVFFWGCNCTLNVKFWNPSADFAPSICLLKSQSKQVKPT